ncbi:4'-phosphopantetheinyl transferase [Vibrio sp. EA2]|uniref:4'-phosphopantetheinyl transferase family protein n=1 Tax=Vibrio sp. EA2 TaxID=3079860 RepID=UPI0029492A0F|nr:4'-phosphopantetheinyl transferase superfamily protein [Vibrio sp. EA2]MDV6253040.1 4'-phosphopantetheinyl transferase superfamily protein [Vibrio sp. EA2]
MIQFVKATPEMYATTGLPLEEKLIQKSVKKRQEEFRAGRHAVRAAIAKLLPNQAFVDQTPILVGLSREPIFPDTISGSISHTDTLCLAACALKNDVPSIGIDVENNQKLGSQLLPAIYTHNEQVRLQESDVIPNILIFSIKESLFKCLFPFVQVYFDFLDAEITLHPETANSGQFQFELVGDNRSHLQSALPNLAFHGHYCFTEQSVFSLCFFCA